MRLRALALLCPALLALASSVHAASQSELPVVELTSGMFRIEAELADSEETREIGLMGRSTMPLQHGMLFVFPYDGKHCMWMKNTLLPLSVAFIDDQGKITNIEEMAPQTENNHCAATPARFALEMNKGWFSDHGLHPGTVLPQLKGKPAARQ